VSVEQQNTPEANLMVHKLVLRGFSEAINEVDLEQHFSSFGHIVNVSIMKDGDGSFNKN